ncbi:hypothetical protein BN1708_019877, partial [Verticillium longisporum]
RQARHQVPTGRRYLPHRL